VEVAVGVDRLDLIALAERAALSFLFAKGRGETDRDRM